MLLFPVLSKLGVVPSCSLSFVKMLYKLVLVFGFGTALDLSTVAKDVHCELEHMKCFTAETQAPRPSFPSW